MSLPKIERAKIEAVPLYGMLSRLEFTATDPNAIVDPKPLLEISPWLYMQFMEPLGATDGSVEACWDYDADDWRKDFVDALRDLARASR